MMDRNRIFVYIAVSLVMLVPVPGRLYFGVPIIISLNFLMVVTTLFNHLLEHLKFHTMKPACLLLMLVAATVFFRQLLILYSPVTALTMGFILYIPAVSIPMLGQFFTSQPLPLVESLSINMKEAGFFSIYSTVFFLLRDIVGYSTISFPVPSGIFKLELPTLSYFSPFTFWGSIPGALIISGLLLAAISFVKKYLGILSRSDEL